MKSNPSPATLHKLPVSNSDQLEFWRATELATSPLPTPPAVNPPTVPTGSNIPAVSVTKTVIAAKGSKRAARQHIRASIAAANSAGATAPDTSIPAKASPDASSPLPATPLENALSATLRSPDVRMDFFLPWRCKQWLQKAARKRDRSMSGIMRELIERAHKTGEWEFPQ